MSAHVPMPVRIEVMLTVREDGTREGLPVVVLSMVDVTGEVRVIHLEEDTMRSLVTDAMVALRQLRQNATSMPPPWSGP